MSSSESKEQGSAKPSLEDQLERLKPEEIQEIAGRWWKDQLEPSGWVSFEPNNIEDWGFLPVQYLEAGLTIEEVQERGTRGVHYAEGHLDLFLLVYKNGKFGSFDGETKYCTIRDYEGPALPEFFEEDDNDLLRSTPMAAVPPLPLVEQKKSCVQPAAKQGPAVIPTTISAPEQSRSPVQPASKKARVEKTKANQSTRGPSTDTSSIDASNWSHPRDTHMQLLRNTSRRPHPLVAVGQGNSDATSENGCQQNREKATTHKRTRLEHLKFLEGMVGVDGYDTTQEVHVWKRIANLEEEILPVARKRKLLRTLLKRLEILETNAKKLVERVKELEQEWKLVLVDTHPLSLKERVEKLEREASPSGKIQSGRRLVERITLL